MKKNSIHSPRPRDERGRFISQPASQPPSPPSVGGFWVFFRRRGGGFSPRPTDRGRPDRHAAHPRTRRQATCERPDLRRPQSDSARRPASCPWRQSPVAILRDAVFERRRQRSVAVACFGNIHLVAPHGGSVLQRVFPPPGHPCRGEVQAPCGQPAQSCRQKGRREKRGR